MKPFNVFLAVVVLALAAFLPAAARADEMDDLDVTMEVVDDVNDLEEKIAEMRGPDDVVAKGGQEDGDDEPGGQDEPWHDGADDRSEGESGEGPEDESEDEGDEGFDDDFEDEEEFENDEDELDEEEMEHEDDFEDGDDVDQDEFDDEEDDEMEGEPDDSPDGGATGELPVE